MVSVGGGFDGCGSGFSGGRERGEEGSGRERLEEGAAWSGEDGTDWEEGESCLDLPLEYCWRGELWGDGRRGREGRTNLERMIWTTGLSCAASNPSESSGRLEEKKPMGALALTTTTNPNGHSLTRHGHCGPRELPQLAPRSHAFDAIQHARSAHFPSCSQLPCPPSTPGRDPTSSSGLQAHLPSPSALLLCPMPSSTLATKLPEAAPLLLTLFFHPSSTPSPILPGGLVSGTHTHSSCTVHGTCSAWSLGLFSPAIGSRARN